MNFRTLWRRACMSLLLAIVTLDLAAGAEPAAQSAGQTKPPGAMEPLGFLVGRWEASGGGKPGASSGAFAFEVEAGGRAMLRHNESRSREGLHRDVMLIYAEGLGSLKATYADSEGHVIRYTVSTPDAGSAVFMSDPTDPGPRFRLTYHLNDGVLAIRFEMTSPGDSVFSTYLEGTARMQRPPK